MHKPARTQVAQSLQDFGRLFDVALGGMLVQATVPMRPELLLPEEMSTEGGRRARRSFVLRAEGRPDLPALTVGWVDLVARTAAVRTWSCIEAAHAARFGERPFDVERASYERFVGSLVSQLSALAIFTTMEDHPSPMAERPSEPRPNTGRGIGPLWLTLGALAAFALGVAVALAASF